MANYAEVIKARLDIVDVVKKYAPDLKSAGSDEYKCKCPFPDHDDTDPSFQVYASNGSFYCFGCGNSGDLINFEAKMRYGEVTDETNKQTILDLADEMGIKKVNVVSEKKDQKRDDAISAKIKTQEIMHDYLMSGSSEGALEYLENRCITEEDIEKFGIGAVPKDLYKQLSNHIEDDAIVETGLVKKTDSGEFRNRFPEGVLTFPMISKKDNFSHWHMKFIPEKHKDKNWQIKNDYRGECVMFNEKALNFSELYVTEGPFEVIQIEKRGFPACALCGKMTKKQRTLLKQMPRRGYLFAETYRDDIKLLKFWLDRDENRAGQRQIEKNIFSIGNFQDVLLVKCPEVGQDPDEYLRGGGDISQTEEVGIPNRPFFIEENDEKKVMEYLIPDSEPAEITSFIIRLKYWLRYQNQQITRYVEIITHRGKKLAPLEAEDMQDLRTFSKWVRKYGPYTVSAEKYQFEELMDYLVMTDPQKHIDLVPFYGEFLPGVWLFENGAIMKDGVHWQDEHGITWVNRRDGSTERMIQGVVTKKELTQTRYDKEKSGEILIPPEWASMGDITENLLKNYRPREVEIIIGYCYACIARDTILSIYNCFPQKMMVGFTGEGKTAMVEVMQSLLGCNNTPAATTKTTGKALGRHMVRYVNMMLHLSEYTDKFKNEIKNAFDGHGYSFANKTTDYSTSHLPANAVNLFTTEDYPGGMSVVNRCIITDFKFVEKFVEPKTYETYMKEYVDKGKNIGFLVEVVKKGIDPDELKKHADKFRDDLRRIGKADGKDYTERLLKTYGIVFGCFQCVLERHPSVKEAFDDVGYDTSRNSIIADITDQIDHSEQIVSRQDPLAIWLSNLETLYLKGSLDGMCRVASDSVTFSLDSCHNEVKAYNRRSDGSLSETRREDIASRIEAIFEIPERTQRGSIRMRYTIPKDDLVEFANTSFSKLWSGDYDDDDDGGEVPF